VPILRPEEIRQLPDRQALVVAENAPPLIATLRRCIDGPAGKRLLATQAAARDRVAAARQAGVSLADQTRQAVATARRMAIHAGDERPGREPHGSSW
jgi:type IV secretion system protein VirD4